MSESLVAQWTPDALFLRGKVDRVLPQVPHRCATQGVIAARSGDVERSLGLDILEIEPAGQYGTGPKVTIGDEIAPGLVARFSRQFGQDEYNEATIEYYLSRLLRIRASFSDANVLRSQFIRVERAGIDLLLFFSF